MISAERGALLAVFQRRLGYTFQNLALLDQALTHRSYAHEASDSPGDYERLEFLGDAVLGLMIGLEVYTRYPHAREGALSQLRACLVRQTALAAVARQLELGHFLRLGRGEEQNGGRDKDSLLAASFEAVVAALYLDGGATRAQQVIVDYFAALHSSEECETAGQDYKGLLQAHALSLFGCLPTYRTVQEEGPAHQKVFHVQLTLPQGHQCVGRGRSKKAAEQQAAQQLLALLSQTATASEVGGAGR